MCEKYAAPSHQGGRAVSNELHLEIFLLLFFFFVWFLVLFILFFFCVRSMQPPEVEPLNDELHQNTFCLFFFLLLLLFVCLLLL